MEGKELSLDDPQAYGLGYQNTLVSSNKLVIN